MLRYSDRNNVFYMEGEYICVVGMRLLLWIKLIL